jgi:Leucine-rich repeat (LRR) protein
MIVQQHQHLRTFDHASPLFILHLDLSFNTIQDLHFLQAFKNLHTLHLAHNAIETLDALPTLPFLTTLNLTGNRLTDQTVRHNYKKLPSLNELFLDTDKP